MVNHGEPLPRGPALAFAPQPAKARGMQQDERSGLLFALAGFAFLSVGDAIIKTMAGAWPPTGVAALRYTLGAIGLGVLLYRREGPGGFRLPRPGVQLMRGAGVAFATLSFFSAVFVMPLATATAIVFTSPMLTAVLAIVMLGEESRKETWISLVTGFAGVMLVLRPDPADFDWSALLPLGSAIGMSFVMIGNRMSARLASPLAMQFSIASIAAPILVTAALLGVASGLPELAIGWPQWHVALRCAVVAVTATTAHWLVYLGTTRAGAATVAPMTYVQMLVATLLGIVLFGDIPDWQTLVGAALIIGAGLYLWNAGRLQSAKISP